MSWNKDKERTDRNKVKRKNEKEMSRYLHDLFFGRVKQQKGKQS